MSHSTEHPKKKSSFFFFSVFKSLETWLDIFPVWSDSLIQFCKNSNTDFSMVEIFVAQKILRESHHRNNGQKPKVLYPNRKIKGTKKIPIHLNDNLKCNGVLCWLLCFRLFRLYVCRCEVPQQQVSVYTHAQCATINEKPIPNQDLSFSILRLSISPASLTFVIRESL